MSERQQALEMLDYWQDIKDCASRQLEYATNQHDYYLKKLGEIATNEATNISDSNIDNATKNREIS